MLSSCYLVPDLKSFQSFITEYNVGFGFFIYELNYVEIASFCTLFIEVHELWILSNALFASIEMIMWFFSISLMSFIMLILLQHQACSEIVLHLLSLTILQLYHLPPPLLLPVFNCSCLSTPCQPQQQYTSCCTVLLHFSRRCTERFKMFSLFLVLVFIYYLCEKHYRRITVQFYNSWLC